MRSFNRCELIGYAAGKPELRKTQKGTSMCSFRVATNDGWGENEETNWHTVKAFGKTAELLERMVEKGSPIFLAGRISYRNFKGDDGQYKHFTDIVVSEFVMLPGGSNGGYQPGEEEAASRTNGDDIPF